MRLRTQTAPGKDTVRTELNVVVEAGSVTTAKLLNVMVLGGIMMVEDTVDPGRVVTSGGRVIVCPGNDTVVGGEPTVIVEAGKVTGGTTLVTVLGGMTTIDVDVLGGSVLIVVIVEVTVDAGTMLTLVRVLKIVIVAVPPAAVMVLTEVVPGRTIVDILVVPG